MRIVSLLPSATEILCALGLQDALVGVSHECDYPAGVSELPILTGSILDSGLSAAQIDDAVKRANMEHRPIYRVDGELLASLRPDLIVTQGVCSVCAVTEETVATSLDFLPVDRACEAPVLSLQAKSYAGVQADIQAVGKATDRVAEAAALCVAMDARWGNVLGPTQDRAEESRVLVLEWVDPPWSAGHWVPEQVKIAGGVDVCGAAGGDSRRISWEDIVQNDPDHVVVACCGWNLEQNVAAAHVLLEHPVAARLRALREGKIWAVDANSFFSRPAPRVVRGAELLGAVLAGDVSGCENEVVPVLQGD